MVARFTTQVKKNLETSFVVRRSNGGGKAVVARFLLPVLM